MNECKWTPGPWAYRPQEYDDWGYVRGPMDTDGFREFICQAKDVRATEDDENDARRNGTDPWAANACLIAAAPELYEALQAMIDLQDNATPFGGEIYRDRVDHVFDQCRAALSKARGEA